MITKMESGRSHPNWLTRVGPWIEQGRMHFYTFETFKLALCLSGLETGILESLPSHLLFASVSACEVAEAPAQLRPKKRRDAKNSLFDLCVGRCVFVVFCLMAMEWSNFHSAVFSFELALVSSPVHGSCRPRLGNSSKSACPMLLHTVICFHQRMCGISAHSYTYSGKRDVTFGAQL